MAGRFSRILRHKLFKFRLDAFMFLVRGLGGAEAIATSAQLLEELMSTGRCRGGSIPNRRGDSPFCTQRHSLKSAAWEGHRRADSVNVGISLPARVAFVS
jgi:hypothetical protein